MRMMQGGSVGCVVQSIYLWQTSGSTRSALADALTEYKPELPIATMIRLVLAASPRKQLTLSQVSFAQGS
jgi:hypothetical protein